MRALLMKTLGKQSHEAVLRRKREAGQRWKREANSAKACVCVCHVHCCTAHHSPMRSVWSKERPRSSYWWEHIEKATDYRTTCKIGRASAERVYYRKWAGPSVDTTDPSHTESKVWWFSVASFWNYSQPKLDPKRCMIGQN